MAAKPKALPRLVPGAAKQPPQTREVNLPGLGASVLIKRITVGEFNELQEGAGSLSALEQSIALAGVAMVEPEMTPEDFAAAVKGWPPGDWVALSTAVVDLAGIGAEALAAAQRDFRDA